MLHIVTSYMKQNKSRKQTLESAQYGLEISFNRVAVNQSSTGSHKKHTIIYFSCRYEHKSKALAIGICCTIL